MLWLHIYPGHYPSHFVGPFQNGVSLFSEYVRIWRFCEAEVITEAQKEERQEIDRRTAFLGADRPAAPWAYGFRTIGQSAVAIGQNSVAIGHEQTYLQPGQNRS